MSANQRHILTVDQLILIACVYEHKEVIRIILTASAETVAFDKATRDRVDDWFYAIADQWRDDFERTISVLDPQHIMTTA